MMNFGEALIALKAGHRIRRTIWHDDVSLVLVPGSTFEVTADRPFGRAFPDLIGQSVNYAQHIDIHCADGSVSVWAGPSHGCVLAEDWEAVD